MILNHFVSTFFISKDNENVKLLMMNASRKINSKWTRIGILNMKSFSVYGFSGQGKNQRYIYIYIVNIFQWLIWEGNLLTYNFMISELYKTQQD